MNYKSIQALAVMIGYIIGVGMFGLPFITAKSGYISFLFFLLFIGLVQYLIHLIYTNIIIITKDYHRLPGYVGLYFGKFGKISVFFAKMIGGMGALLAYMIITGIFLNQLLNPYFGGNENIYAIIAFAIWSTIVLLGIKSVAKAELGMSFLLLVTIILIAVKGVAYSEASNFLAIDWKYLILPYGAMLFALDGVGSLPVVVKILRRDKDKLKKVIAWGTFIPVVVVAAFTLSIVGISGASTTPDALIGIQEKLGDGMITLALIFGILAMSTSFIPVAEALRETLWWDFKVNRYLAWAIAVFIPFIIYVLGVKDLIGVISFAGAVSGGYNACMLVLVFRKIKQAKGKLPLFKHQPSGIITYPLIAMFISGIIYEIIMFLK